MSRNTQTKIVLKEDQYKKLSRTFGYYFSDLTIKTAFFHNDITSFDFQKAIIIHTISIATGSKFIKSPELMKLYGSMDVKFPTEQQVPCSALSVSEATGLPRETTRRKIKEMVAEDLLEEDPRGGYRLKSGILQRPLVQTRMEEFVKALVRVVNVGLDLGVLEATEVNGEIRFARRTDPVDSDGAAGERSRRPGA